MERIKVNTNWFLDEFIDPVTYFTTPDHGLSLVDPALFDIAQFYRDKYGKPLTINDWWKHLPVDLVVFDPLAFLRLMESKKVPVWSGIRTSLCSVGAKASAHRLRKEKVFRAIDIRDKKESGEEKVFYQIMKDNTKQLYALGLRRMEDKSVTIGWGHLDTLSLNCKPDSIRVIDKTKCTETIYF